MNFIFNLFRKKKKENVKPVLIINFDGIEKFKGFNYSVKEGIKLSKNSYTELPEFDEYKKDS